MRAGLKRGGEEDGGGGDDLEEHGWKDELGK